jgi:transcription initiation factor TFIIF subunit beta
MTAWQGRRASGDPWLRLLDLSMTVVSLTFLHPNHATPKLLSYYARYKKPPRKTLRYWTRREGTRRRDTTRPHSRRQLSGRNSFVAKMNGIKQDPYGIKADPDAGTPVQYMDDEFFEDTGEMTMPQPDTKSDVWLTRIEKWLYDAVSTWEDLAEGNDNDQIQIGEVLAFNTTSGIDKSRPMRVFFSERWRAKSKLPTAFEIQPTQTTDTVLGNTYVFTEKDLPGYKPNGFGQGYRGGPGSYSTQDPKARIQKRGKYRKAIPKQTALIGHATRQYQMNPLPTKEYKDFEAQRLHQAIQGSHMETVIIKDPGIVNYNNVQSKFQSFIKPTTKSKPQQNKAARISHRELLDLLHSLFDEYEYTDQAARAVPQGGAPRASPSCQVRLFCKPLAATAAVQHRQESERPAVSHGARCRRRRFRG